MQVDRERLLQAELEEEGAGPHPALRVPEVDLLLPHRNTRRRRRVLQQPRRREHRRRQVRADLQPHAPEQVSEWLVKIGSHASLGLGCGSGVLLNLTFFSLAILSNFAL